MKKIVVFLIAVLLVFSATGCKNSNKNPIFLGIEDSVVGLNSVVTLRVNADCDQENIVWSSSNSDVLKVEDGVVTGLSVGKAKLQAEYNGEKQTQKIKVKKLDYQLEVQDSIALSIGQRYNLDMSLGETAPVDKEVVYAINVKDTSIATVDDTVITAISTGNTTIDVSVKIDGKEVIEKVVELKVYDNVGIFPEREEYNLYLTEEFRDVKFDKMITLDGEIYRGGAIYDGQISWSVGDETVAKINEGKIVAVSEGETYVVGSSEVDGKTYETIQIPVTVEPSIVELNDDVIIDISKSEQVFNSANLFGRDQTVGWIQNSETGRIITISENKVKTSMFSSGEYDYLVYNGDKTMGAKVVFHCADFVVEDLADLNEIRKAEHVNDYIVLANDIEVNGMFGDNLKNEFRGVFNGLGHTIFGMELSKRDSGGLFNAVRGATVKNVAFVGAKISTWNSGVIAYINPYETSQIDNVYVDVEYSGSDIAFSGGLIGFGHVGEIRITNTVVCVDGLNRDQVKDRNGLLLGRMFRANANIQDVYVVGRGNVCGCGVNQYNITYESLNKSASYVYANDELFNNELAKEDSRITFDNFNHYWNVENGVPHFYSSIVQQGE